MAANSPTISLGQLSIAYRTKKPLLFDNCSLTQFTDHRSLNTLGTITGILAGFSFFPFFVICLETMPSINSVCSLLIYKDAFSSKQSVHK